MTRFPLAVAILGGCEPPPPTPSDQIVVPYQFNLEFSLEAEPGLDHIARARLYDIAQAYDVLGNAGTIELTGGDAVYADDIALDIETRTTTLGMLRVDYSQGVPAGEADYRFELRRPDDERIEADIPAPDPLEVAPVGDVRWDEPWAELTWTPVVEGANLDIGIRPVTDDCLIVVGDEVGDVVNGLDDIGSYRFDTDVYHSLDHDCTYELVFTRRFVGSAPGTWHVDGQDLPANNVWAIGIHTVKLPFVALQR